MKIRRDITPVNIIVEAYGGNEIGQGSASERSRNPSVIGYSASVHKVLRLDTRLRGRRACREQRAIAGEQVRNILHCSHELDRG